MAKTPEPEFRPEHVPVDGSVANDTNLPPFGESNTPPASHQIPSEQVRPDGYPYGKAKDATPTKKRKRKRT